MGENPQKRRVGLRKTENNAVPPVFNGPVNHAKDALYQPAFSIPGRAFPRQRFEKHPHGAAVRIGDQVPFEGIDHVGGGEHLTFMKSHPFSNVKGIGLKEASHFLRNIGFGRDLAILDVHILKNMVKYGILKEIPKNISKARYLELESKLKRFAKKVNISMDELDLLFWASQTGMVFK